MEVNHQKWKPERQENDGLQVNRDHEGLQAAPIQSDALWKYRQEAPRRRILGLSIVTFWMVTAIFLLVLAGAVGGGIAGGLAAQKKTTTSAVPSLKSSSSISSATAQSQSTAGLTPSKSSSIALSTSPSTSSSTSSAASSGPSPVISTPCTASLSNNGTTLTATDSTGTNKYLGAVPHVFTLLCNTNYPAGSAYGNPNVIDLYKIYTPDMASCIDTCIAYNLAYAVTSGASPECVAVAVVKAPGEFCYLKSATGINDTSSSGGEPIDTALLIG